MKIPVLAALVLFALPLAAVAQTSKLSYKEKLNYNKRLTPEAAMLNAWHWFDNHTKGTPDAGELKMRNEHGIFRGESVFPFVSTVASGNEYSKGVVRFTVHLRIHDTEGAYTYVITNFEHQARVSLNTITTDDRYPYPVKGDKMWENMVWKDIKTQLDRHVQELAASLKAAMDAPTSVINNKLGPKIIIVKN